MLCRKFKLIPIKSGFFTNFSSCSKIRPKSLYYSTARFNGIHALLQRKCELTRRFWLSFDDYCQYWPNVPDESGQVSCGT